MALDLDMLDDDLAMMVDDLPETFTVNGVTFNGTAGEATHGASLDDVGFLGEASAVFVMRTTGVYRLPLRGQSGTLGRNGTTYRIDRIMESQDGLSLMFYLMDPEK